MSGASATCVIRRRAKSSPLRDLPGTIEERWHFAKASEITGLASGALEYDASVVATGVAHHSPCQIGFIENGQWTAINGRYRLEISCHVRSSIVRLSRLKNEKDLTGPPDLTKYETLFNEDCTPDELDSLFVHPMIGPIRVPNAGRGRFWIAFDFPTWTFPALRNDSIDLLDPSLVALARNTSAWISSRAAIGDEAESRGMLANLRD